MSTRTPSPPLILLAGPTATGKTALAIALARRLDAEIVSADSMQVFRGCAIGTAQPTRAELRGVPCSLVGCVEPDRSWSVADWLGAARAAIASARERGRAVLVVGGTGLYFKALCDGLFEAPGAHRNAAIRERLEAQWDEDKGEGLWARLCKADPQAAQRIHRNDRLRVVRALEVFESTGTAMSLLQASARERHAPPPAWRFVLSAGRADLYARIDRRVLAMVEAGFVGEVEKLIAQGADASWPAMRALGYAPMLRHARGEATLAQAIEETQRQSRRYAKQQIVLYRKWNGAIWLDAMRGVEKNARAIQIVLEF